MAKSYLQHLLGDREKVIIATRQHWFILASSIFLESALIVVLLAGAGIAAVFFPPFGWIIVGIGIILALLPFVAMVNDILVWANRQFIVTNRRVIQISGLFNKNVIDSSLDKVNDVKMEQSFLGRLFGYGDIEILTASELGVNLFRRIGEPIKFKSAMINAKERLERGEEDAQRSEDIPAVIANLDHLRQQGILSEEEFQQKKRELLARM